MNPDLRLKIVTIIYLNKHFMNLFKTTVYVFVWGISPRMNTSYSNYY